jgi:hypothetical protein
MTAEDSPEILTGSPAEMEDAHASQLSTEVPL